MNYYHEVIKTGVMMERISLCFLTPTWPSTDLSCVIALRRQYETDDKADSANGRNRISPPAE